MSSKKALKKILKQVESLTEKVGLLEKRLLISAGSRALHKNGKAFAVIRDAALYQFDNAPNLDFNKSDIVSERSFLGSFAKAADRQRNVGSIWESNLDLLLQNPKRDDLDEGLNIAQNKSDKLVALTTVDVLGAGKTVTPVHILNNFAAKKTLIVGNTAISKSLQSAFAAAGISYISRSERDAGKKVEQALSAIVPAGLNAERLVEAFMYRNDLDDKVTLAAALTDRKVDRLYPKYVVKTSAL